MRSEEIKCVVTCVSTDGSPLQEEPLGHLVAEACSKSLKTRRLGPDAIDFHVMLGEDACASLQSRLLDEVSAVDICVQPELGREKRLLLCDMDSTIIEQECIDELADYAGLKEAVSQITERAMQGELDFEAALTERVALLKDLPISVLDTCFKERITLTQGAKTIVETMSARGATCQLVSGGFTYFTSRVAKAAGFGADYANILVDNGETLTGEVARPILGKQAKLDRLNTTLAELSLRPEQAITIGDGANDGAMIEAAGLGVGFNPHPVLAKLANAIVSGSSLTTALYFQGIPKTEWVS